MFQKFAGLIHYRQLTARTQTRINAEHAVRSEWWGHKETPQIALKNGDRFGIRPFFEGSAHFSLQRWEEQTLVGILAIGEQIWAKGRRELLDHSALYEGECLRGVNLNAH